MACMSRKFWGSDSWPTLLETRAAMGTAETPALPMSGLTGCFGSSLFISLAIRTPAPVPKAKATIPKSRMPRVLRFRKWEASIFEPTESPRKIVTIFIRAFCMVSERRLATPHSLARLPNIRLPTSGVAEGSRMAHAVRTVSGKRIFSSFETGLSCCILINRSSLVVRARMIGGWMMGTKAM
ncbi:hypothetical protein SDC9_192903 [bioreactor metagenome]|uniref:Uncharacterized protein n=1 Tax=bioreactor metagenome TaxID=1076179 RepID=A0A645I389_9ZZZZ